MQTGGKCLGRLTIDLLVQQSNFARAMDVARECLKINENFVLSDPVNLILFTKKAIELEEYDLAYQIIQSSRQRYGNYVNTIQCQILEAQILLRYLNRYKQARTIVSALLRLEPNNMSQEIFALAAELNNTSSAS